MRFTSLAAALAVVLAGAAEVAALKPRAGRAGHARSAGSVGDNMRKWLAGAMVASTMATALPMHATAATKLDKLSDYYVVLERLREDIIEDEKTESILSELKTDFTADLLKSVALKDHESFKDVDFKDQDVDTDIDKIVKEVQVIRDILLEPFSPDKKALRIVAFRQLSRRVEAEIHGLEKLVTGATAKMEDLTSV